ncbi:MAG: hypothetical protein M0T76_04340 [Desulfobacteraceae bacterium]|nr:hypothetical protein [Desulfobacteraceae bacterium]
MRQMLINELTKDERERIKKFLDENVRPGGVAGLYWLAIPERLWGEAQRGHEACGPFSFAIELGGDFISLELLVRSASNLHCPCTGYATAEQRHLLLEFLDRLTGELAIRA